MTPLYKTFGNSLCETWSWFNDWSVYRIMEKCMERKKNNEKKLSFSVLRIIIIVIVFNEWVVTTDRWLPMYSIRAYHWTDERRKNYRKNRTKRM